MGSMTPFEQCADVVVTKLQSYYQQADDYHNQCFAR